MLQNLETDPNTSVQNVSMLNESNLGYEDDNSILSTPKSRMEGINLSNSKLVSIASNIEKYELNIKEGIENNLENSDFKQNSTALLIEIKTEQNKISQFTPIEQEKIEEKLGQEEAIQNKEITNEQPITTLEKPTSELHSIPEQHLYEIALSNEKIIRSKDITQSSLQMNISHELVNSVELTQSLEIVHASEVPHLIEESKRNGVFQSIETVQSIDISQPIEVPPPSDDLESCEQPQSCNVPDPKENLQYDNLPNTNEQSQSNDVHQEKTNTNEDLQPDELPSSNEVSHPEKLQAIKISKTKEETLEHNHIQSEIAQSIENPQTNFVPLSNNVVESSFSQVIKKDTLNSENLLDLQHKSNDLPQSKNIDVDEIIKNGKSKTIPNTHETVALEHSKSPERFLINNEILTESYKTALDINSSDELKNVEIGKPQEIEIKNHEQKNEQKDSINISKNEVQVENLETQSVSHTDELKHVHEQEIKIANETQHSYLFDEINHDEIKPVTIKVSKPEKITISSEVHDELNKNTELDQNEPFLITNTLIQKKEKDIENSQIPNTPKSKSNSYMKYIPYVMFSMGGFFASFFIYKRFKKF